MTYQVLLRTRCGCTLTMFVRRLEDLLFLPLKPPSLNVLGITEAVPMTGLNTVRVFRMSGKEDGLYLYEEYEDV